MSSRGELYLLELDVSAEEPSPTVPRPITDFEQKASVRAAGAVVAALILAMTRVPTHSEDIPRNKAICILHLLGIKSLDTLALVMV